MSDQKIASSGAAIFWEVAMDGNLANVDGVKRADRKSATGIPSPAPAKSQTSWRREIAAEYKVDYLFERKNFVEERYSGNNSLANPNSRSPNNTSVSSSKSVARFFIVSTATLIASRCGYP